MLPPGFEAAAAVDVGRVRKVNQDRAAAHLDPTRTFATLVVCDGLGGLEDGERAAEVALTTILAALEAPEVEAADAIERAAHVANQSIYDVGGGRMGTTLAAVAITGTAFEVLHAGDSRVYLYRNGELRPVSLDHSWVAEQVLAGRMTPEEAMSDPRRNMVTRCLGTSATVEIERSGALAWAPGDVILACSDGLHGMVRLAHLATLLSANPRADVMARDLIDAANAAGGQDNIAVALARFPNRRTPGHSYPAAPLPVP